MNLPRHCSRPTLVAFRCSDVRARGLLLAAAMLAAGCVDATELDLIVPAGLAGGDEAAFALAMDDERVAVGLPGAAGGSGAVVVLNCGGSACVQEQRLELTPARPGAAFGSSVALAGTALAVGLPNHGSGAVQMFRRTGNVWSFERELASGAAGDRFGLAVALVPGHVAVGAPRSSGGDGRVELFAEAAGSWTHQQTLPAPSAGGKFGHSLALDGSSLLVGAPFLPGSGAGSFGRGSVYAYVLSGSVWTLQATLQPAAIADGDLFGYSVALDGDLAVAGAPRRAGARGSGFVFRRSGVVWSEQVELVASRSLAGDYFGWSAALAGERIGLGAPFASADPGGGCGRLQIFDGPGPWQENSLADVAQSQAGELAGWSVAASGIRWLAGAPGRAIGASGHYGAIYRFDPDRRLFADGFQTPTSPCAP